MLEVENLHVVLVALHPPHQVDPVIGAVYDEVVASFAPNRRDWGEDSEDHGHLRTSGCDGPTLAMWRTPRRLASITKPYGA